MRPVTRIPSGKVKSIVERPGAIVDDGGPSITPGALIPASWPTQLALPLGVVREHGHLDVTRCCLECHRAVSARYTAEDAKRPAFLHIV